MSFAEGFLMGQRAAQNGISTYRDAKLKQGMEDVSNATENTVNTMGQSDADKIKAISAETNGDGTPKYTIGFDGQAGYTATPNDGSAAQVINATPKAEFLGKTYDTAPTDQQKDSARTLAMAGVYQANGDPEKALALRSQAAQLDRQATADSRDTQRFGREQQSWKLQDEEQTREKDYRTGREAILAQTPMAQNETAYQAQLADYQKKKAAFDQAGTAPGMEARDVAGIGPAPVAPARPTTSPGQMLGSYADLVAHDAKHGKLSTEGFINFGQKLQQVKDEGYAKALNLARSGGAIEDVANAFNETGKTKFDPKSVISDKMVKGPDGVPTRMIQFKDASGQVQTINTTAELDSLGKADQVYSRFYQANADKRGAAQLGLAGNSDRRAQAEFDSNAPVREAAGEIAKLKTELAKTDDPKQQALLSDKITALASGRRGANVQHDAADVAKAKVLVSQGIYPNDGEALDAIINKPDKLYQSYKDSAMKVSMNADSSIESAKKMMTDDGWVRSSGGTWKRAGSASAATAAGPAKGAVVNGFEFQGGNPNDKASWKAVTK